MMREWSKMVLSYLFTFNTLYKVNLVIMQFWSYWKTAVCIFQLPKTNKIHILLREVWKMWKTTTFLQNRSIFIPKIGELSSQYESQGKEAIPHSRQYCILAALWTTTLSGLQTSYSLRYCKLFLQVQRCTILWQYTVLTWNFVEPSTNPNNYGNSSVMLWQMSNWMIKVFVVYKGTGTSVRSIAMFEEGLYTVYTSDQLTIQCSFHVRVPTDSIQGKSFTILLWKYMWSSLNLTWCESIQNNQVQGNPSSSQVGYNHTNSDVRNIRVTIFLL